MQRQRTRTLRVLWQRWTGVVALFANRAPGRRRLDPAEYERLYRELLRACEAAAESADPRSTAWLADLQHLVRPWLSSTALQQADQELLTDLLARCRRVEEQLGGRGCLGPLARLLAWLGLGCLLTLALVLAARWLRETAAEAALSGWWSLRLDFRQTRNADTWAIGGGLVALTLLLLGLVRAARR
jgi:hypothetical protein